MPENAGAFVRGCPGGEDVIDQDDPFPAEFFKEALFDLEGPAEIGETLFSIELCLGLGGADPTEGVAMDETADFGKLPGEFVGLIALSPLLTSPVERNRDQDGIAVVLKSFVCLESFLHEMGEVASEEKLAAVFDGVDKMK